MENRVCMFLLYSTMAATLFVHCDARTTMELIKNPNHAIKHTMKLQLMSKLMSLVIEQPTDTSNSQPYVSPPFSLPPFDSLPPLNSPPYCVNPPPTPIGTSPSPPSPSYNFPPLFPGQSPPPGPPGTPNPPETVPNPPSIFPSPPGALNPPAIVPSPPSTFPNPPGTPNPPQIVPNPPSVFPSPPHAIPPPTVYVPSPSGPTLSPPFNVPSPFGFNPSPPEFLPPIVYPPPTVPPAPRTGPTTALWCVAKPSVPGPIMQEAMNYACASGADCDSIQPSGSCFEPNTVFAHASYAFNSYWQKTKVAGGTCEFGGTAILVTVDPSYDGCHFEYQQ
ncbi:extensin-like [Hibiscus syriacus]|uniref:extensin-like n=1 Tax=Hibiscus syriacus TaxID=106335 RepID=UPI001920E602|nr:extensin-like [Hibiscus syriacus]